MNLCVVSEYNCTFDEFEVVIKESEEEMSAFVSDYKLVKVNEGIYEKLNVRET